MEKVLNEQSIARLAIIHCKIAASQLVSMATETANPALRHEVQQTLRVNLEQQKNLWDAAFHAGYFPIMEPSIHPTKQGKEITPSARNNEKGGA
jgi:spore coat protein CotF